MKHKLIAAGMAALFAIIFSSAVLAANPDFSGTWTLDTAKSEGLPPGMSQTMTVTQSGDKLTLETKVTTGQGEQTIADAYTLDGKETEFTPKTPDGTSGKGKRTAKWAENGGIEVNEISTFDTPNGDVEVKMNRKWTLSADGKTLQIDIDAESPQGTQHIKRVFNKK